MKTYRQILIEAGVPAEELALVEDTRDLDEQADGYRQQDIPECLNYVFFWNRSPQGYDYWNLWYCWLQCSEKPGPSAALLAKQAMKEPT